MAKLSNAQLTAQVRNKYLSAILDFLANQLGEDARQIANNGIGFPVVDGNGNERAVKIVVSVPRGSRLDNEEFDVYSEEETFKLHQQEQAEKKAHAEKEKAEAAAQREAKRQAAKAKKEEKEKKA